MCCQIVCNVASNFLCLFIIFWIATPVCYTVNSCAYFKFLSPAMDGQKITAKEYTTVFIKFKLITKGCTARASSSYIEIGIWIPGSNQVNTQCRIIEKNNGSCSESEFHNALCSCTPDPGVYTFSKTVNRTDNAEWKWNWWASKDTSNETLIRFEISYPTRITELSFDGKETLEPLHVQRNRSVLVKCFWKSGNPPTSVSLLHGHTVLAKINSLQSEYLTYTLKLDTCDDSGIIYCAADISDNNKTATLLVECPPEFVSTPSVVHNLTSWKTNELRFPVHTHTLVLTLCTLANQNGKEYQCRVGNISNQNINANNTKCQCIMTGVPPNIILTLHVNDQNIEAGQWILNTSNVVGSSLAKFTLFRHEAQEESDGSGLGNSPADVKTVLIIILGIVVISVVVGVFVKQRWPLVMRSCSSGSHESPDKETKPEAAHPEKTQNSIDHEHSTPQTTTDVATVNPNIVHAQINQDGKEGEQGVRLFCQGAGVTQVVIYLKDQQTNPDTLLPNTMAIPGPADYLTPCAPQYAMLDQAPQCTRNNSQILQSNTCPRCDDHQKQNPPHYCSFPLSNECDNKLDSVHPVNDKLSDLALKHENLNKLVANNFSVDNSIPKMHSDDYMYSSID